MTYSILFLLVLYDAENIPQFQSWVWYKHNQIITSLPDWKEEMAFAFMNSALSIYAYK